MPNQSLLSSIFSPKGVTWLILLIVINTNLNFSYWKSENRIIVWDVISYYAYLPATFIYQDPSLEFADEVPDEVRKKIWYHTTESGGRAIKTSMGIAMLYSPFFFVGHSFALISEYGANGYTVPYRFMLIVSSIFYLAIGMYFMRKTLIRFFPPWVVTLTIVSVVMGTNLFYYTTTEPTMPHVYNFALLAAFIYHSILWHEKSSVKRSVIIGLLAGLIALARPTNILVALVFIFWDVYSLDTLKHRVSTLINNYKGVLIMVVLSLMVWIPQLLWWKTVSGQWFYFSYGDESFFFSNPQIWNGLFSYRKGWLLYTPIMTLALLGIPLLYKELRSSLVPILLFTLLNIYIILSWWAWWYGGSYGLRAFIDSYALMAIPMASFIWILAKRSTAVKVIVVSMVFILISFNQFQTLQHRYGVIHWDSMTKEAYWASFGKLDKPKGFNEMIAKPDYEKAKQGIQ